jgi:SET domain-containing protein
MIMNVPMMAQAQHVTRTTPQNRLKCLILCSLWLGLMPFAVQSFAIPNKKQPKRPQQEQQQEHYNNDHRPILPLTSFSHCSAKDEGIDIRQTKKKGLGAFVLTPVLSGAWVGEYSGELLTMKEVQSRYWNKRKRTKSDRRWIKSRSRRNQGTSGDYLFDMGDELFIDGEDADVSTWCRFMNHASETTNACNVETRSTREIWDGEKIVPPRLWFVATRDVKIGEELLYDYGDSYWDDA